MKQIWTKISIATFLFLSISYSFQSKDRDFFRVIDSTDPDQSKSQGPISFVQHVQIAKQNGLKTPNTFFLPVIVAYPKGETLSYTLDSLQNYIFGDHIGSLSQYFSEVSYGKFQLTGKVYALKRIQGSKQPKELAKTQGWEIRRGKGGCAGSKKLKKISSHNWVCLVWKMFPHPWRLFLSYLEIPSAHIRKTK